MRVVTFLNQKGGVGKTSTCYHLAGTLSRDGRRVLLVDSDPQASLTQGFLGPDATYSLDPSRTVAAIYRGDEPFPERVVRQGVLPGVDLLPGSEGAKTYNRPDAHREPRPLRHCLREFLAEVSGRYEYALIDVPPNLHLCSWAALAASRHVVVPMQPEEFGAQGIASVNASVDEVAGVDSPHLRILGYLITMISPRRAVHQAYEQQLRELYGDLVFAASVPESTEFPEATSRRLPIAQYKPRGKSAQAIRALVDEFYRRLEAAEFRDRGAA